MRKILQFKTFAILMACMLSVPMANAQDYDDIWDIDGVQYKYYAGEAMVVGCDVDNLDIPPEVNLSYENDDGDVYDRIVPVSIIGNSAFNNSWIGTVDLGKNVTDLYYHSFYNCSYLSDIVCRSTTPPSVNSAFSSDMYSRVTLHVPSSALSAYKNHSEWKKFTNIVAITTEWGVDINSTNFPDANFRNYVLWLYPKGYLTRRDMQRCTSISVQNKNIANLKGIEFFTGLEELKCWGNSFSSLDLNKNTNLTYLDCAPNNNLTSLLISSCAALKTLICYNTGLTALNANQCTALQYVNCSNTNISELDITSKPNLTSLICTNCTSLKYLRCWGNHNLLTLNVTGNNALTYLDCAPDNNLASIIGLADCTAMKQLYCRDCALTDLSAVAGMNDLEYLSCYNNRLSSLVVSYKSNLTTVLCYGNTSMSLLDVTYNPSLTYLNCNNCPALTEIKAYRNKLTSFNVTGNTAVKRLYCYENSNLKAITGLADCTAVTYLDCEDCAITDLSAVNSLPRLEQLYCRNNKITTLRVTQKPNLTYLRASSNSQMLNAQIYNNGALTQLDLHDCSAMEDLICAYNNLQSINVTGCSALSAYQCQGNSLSSLNLSDLPSLGFLYCMDNNISSLNVMGCPELKVIYCQNNQLSGTGMTTLVNSLPTRPTSEMGYLYAINNDNENNSMTEAQIATAVNKNWTPYRWDGNYWVELQAYQSGDVDGDGNVTISDLAALVDYLLGGSMMGINVQEADVDGDGDVGISDVAALTDRLLRAN